MSEKGTPLSKPQLQALLDRIERIERELGILRSELSATQQRVQSHTVDLEGQREMLARLLELVRSLREQMSSAAPLLEQLEVTLKSIQTKS